MRKKYRNINLYSALRSQWWKSVVVMVLPCTMLFLLGPLEIYYANTADLDINVRDFICFFLLLFIIFLFVFSFIHCLIPKKMKPIFTYLSTGISTMAYIQNAFLNTGIYAADGGAVRWDELVSKTIINTVIWVAFCIIYVVVMYRLKGDKVCCYISAFLSAIQIVALVTILIRVLTNPDLSRVYVADPSEEFTVASEENVIILVLDNTGSKLALQCYDEDNSVLDALSDFTFYTNYDSRFWPTFPSMLHLVSGVEPDPDGIDYGGHDVYRTRAWEADECASFFDVIHSEGYTVNYYGNSLRYVFGNVPVMKERLDNIVQEEPKINFKLLIPFLEKLTVYRYVPFILKPRFETDITHFAGMIEYNKEAVIDDSLEFCEELEKNGLHISETDGKRVSIIHLAGVHFGYWMNEEYEVSKNVTQQEAFAALMNCVVKSYLDELRRLGVYDSATIIILGDHGSIDYLSVENDIQAIFFIKYPNESHQKVILNDAPISSDDFQGTIYRIIDSDYNGSKTSIADWSEGQLRERVTYQLDAGIKGYRYYYNKKDLEDTIIDGFDDEQLGHW